jgi:hypothetical protein
MSVLMSRSGEDTCIESRNLEMLRVGGKMVHRTTISDLLHLAVYTLSRYGIDFASIGLPTTEKC